MGLREAVAHSLNSTHLEPINERESNIDRIGALGRATKLSSALWRWKYGGDSHSAPHALHALLRKAQRRTRIYRHSKDFHILERICKLVLSEWFHPNCRVCNGAREFSEDKLVIVCQSCNGSGLHNHSDRERMIVLNMVDGEYVKWAEKVAEVWLCLSGADAGGAVVCRYQLERK